MKFLKTIRLLPSVLILIYLLILFWQAFILAYGSFSRTAGKIVDIANAKANFIPFKTIWRYLTNLSGQIENFNPVNFKIYFINLFGNIEIFLPFGFLLFFILKKPPSLKQVAVLTLALSLFIELIQASLNLGVFDIDDLILNLLGGVLGYYLAKMIRHALH